jgi:hypothetical protein
MSETENAIREHMRALGRKGAATTKQRYDSAHYQLIGRLGGIRSGAARRTKLCLPDPERGQVEPGDSLHPTREQSRPPSKEAIADRPLQTEIERLAEALDGVL